MMKKSHGSWSSILGFLCNINPLPPPRQESPLSPCPTVLSSLSMGIAYCSKHNFYQRQCLLHEVYSDLLQVPVNFSLSLDPLHWGVTCVFHSLHSALVMILAFFLRPSHATHIPSLNPRLHFLIWPTHSWCPIFKNWIVKKKKTNKLLPTQVLLVSILQPRIIGTNKMGIWGRSPQCFGLAFCINGLTRIPVCTQRSTSSVLFHLCVS